MRELTFTVVSREGWHHIRFPAFLLEIFLQGAKTAELYKYSHLPTTYSLFTNVNHCWFQLYLVHCFAKWRKREVDAHLAQLSIPDAWIGPSDTESGLGARGNNSHQVEISAARNKNPQKEEQVELSNIHQLIFRRIPWLGYTARQTATEAEFRGQCFFCMHWHLLNVTNSSPIFSLKG